MEKELLFTSNEMSLPKSSVTESHNFKGLDAQVFECSICSLTFQTYKLFERHTFVHKNTTIFSCSECQYKCNRKQYLNRHLLMHSKEKKFLCSVCGETFTFHETLKNHVIAKHPSEKPFMCDFCSFQTSGALTLKQHMVKHIHNFIACHLCTYSCSSEAALKKHQATHAVNTSNPCDTCNLTFTTSEDLQAHKLSHMAPDQQNYQCNICPFSSLIQMAYVRHMSAHDVSKPFTCDICHYSSDRKINLKMHMKRKHNLTLPTVVNFKCVHCHFTCERNHDFSKHMLTKHNIEKPFTCLLCPFSTHRQSLLNVHLETHRPHAFECQFCNFKAKRKTLLNKHLQCKHAEVNGPDPIFKKRLFTCKFCNFKSHHYSSLRNHLPKHSDKKFSCSECPYVTYSRRNLASHSKSHVKDKPYRCQFCHYTSARTGNFKMHMVTHINEKKYLCSKCPFVCTYQGDLVDHISSVHYTSNNLEETSKNNKSEHCHQNSTEEPEVHALDNQNNGYTVNNQNNGHAFDNQDIGQAVNNKNDRYTINNQNNGCSMDNQNNGHTVGNQNNGHIVENQNNGHKMDNQNNGHTLDNQNIRHTVDKQNNKYMDDYQNSAHTEGKDNVQHIPSAIFTKNSIHESCKQTKLAHQGEDNSKHRKCDSPMNETNLDVTNSFNVNGEPSCGATDAASTSEVQQITFKVTNSSINNDTELKLLSLTHPSDTNEPVNNGITIKQSSVTSSPDNINNNVYSCWECEYHTQSPSNFSRHMGSSHNIQKPFSCKLCPYSSKRADDLKIHMITHDNGMVRSCGLCDYTCKRLPALRKHVRKHSKVILFSCSLCGFGCNLEPDLRSHMLRAHEKCKYFTCRYCQTSFQFAVHYKNHMCNEHGVENAFLCSHCEYSTNVWNNFRAHKRKHTSKQVQTCKQSDTVHPKTQHQQQNQHHKTERVFKCNVCQQRYKHASSLCKHKTLAHKATAKQHFCHMCTYKTLNISLLKRHLLTHGIGKRFQCSLCHFGCNHKEVLNNHLLLHNDTINIHHDDLQGPVSSITNNIQPTSCNFRQHQIPIECSRNKLPFKPTVSNEDFSRHVCAICDHRFRNTSSLKKHLLRHKKCQKLEIFQCSVCLFKCMRPHELKLHTLTHTGETPYSCSQCDFQCGKPDTLKYHKQKHHPKIQTSSESFTCSLCLFVCRSNLHLQHHLQVKHPVDLHPFNHSHDLQIIKKSDDLSPVKGSLSGAYVTYVSTSMDTASCASTPLHSENSSNASTSTKINKSLSQRSHPTAIVQTISPHGCVSINTQSIDSSTLLLRDESATEETNLTSHIQRNALKSFRCHLCNYTCMSRRELKRHLVTHDRSKSFSCDLCTYSCIHRSSLRVHMMKHKGEKPLACQVCDFRCRQASTLRDHMTRHSDERKFVCDRCGHQAKRATAMKIHLLTHSSEKPIVCPLCDFTCKHKNSLRSHTISHGPKLVQI